MAGTDKHACVSNRRASASRWARSWWRWRWALAWLAALFCLGAAAAAAADPLRITFLDVGQGDATFIVSPTGKTVLVDGGPPEAARRLSERLHALAGGHPLDLVLLTHRHADHLGGLATAVRSVGARLLLDSQYPHPSPLYDELIAALAQGRVEVKDARAGRRIDLGGGAVLTLLGPPDPALSHTRSDVNANSIVARLDYGAFSLLLCGDAEEQTERWLLASGRPLRAQVVKVAHHGSRYASTLGFVRAVRAEVAVVSAGARNDYGHPHAEALHRWQLAGARIVRTDLMGEIRVESDGRRYAVQSEREAATVAPPTVRSAPRRASPPGNVVPAPGDGYVASRRSRIFHRTDCRAAPTIVEHNRMTFASRQEAIRSGRRPAEDCRP